MDATGKTETPNPYNVLEVTREATDKQISSAFKRKNKALTALIARERTLLLKNKTTTEAIEQYERTLEQVMWAYGILSDKEKRVEYDMNTWRGTGLLFVDGQRTAPDVRQDATGETAFNPYNVLGITPEATSVQISEAYQKKKKPLLRKVEKETRSSMKPGFGKDRELELSRLEGELGQLDKAYAILSGEGKRAQHDWNLWTKNMEINNSTATCYDILGVPPDATTEDIIYAYAEKVRAGEASNGVYNAFRVLMDPEERTKYDRRIGNRKCLETGAAQVFSNPDGFDEAISRWEQGVDRTLSRWGQDADRTLGITAPRRVIHVSRDGTAVMDRPPDNPGHARRTLLFGMEKTDNNRYREAISVTGPFNRKPSLRSRESMRAAGVGVHLNGRRMKL